MPSLSPSDSKTLIRPFVSSDVTALLGLIAELAAHEGQAAALQVDEPTLLRDGGFTGEPPCYRCLVVESAGDLVGYALFSHIYSTWEGRALCMNDLYVRESHQGRGVGVQLVQAVTSIALNEHCVRLQWQCLESNKPALRFYQERLRASERLEPDEGGQERAAKWRNYVIEEEKMKALIAGIDAREAAKPLRIRPLVAGDVPQLLKLFKELATFEGQPNAVNVDSATLLRDADLDGKTSDVRYRCLVAQQGEKDELVAYALFFNSYSTYSGRSVYLEDLYVQPGCRGGGAGTQLIAEVMRATLEDKCGRLQWQCIDFNMSGVRFYEDKLGARERVERDRMGTLSKWVNFLMNEQEMKALVAREKDAN